MSKVMKVNEKAILNSLSTVSRDKEVHRSPRYQDCMKVLANNVRTGVKLRSRIFKEPNLFELTKAMNIHGT